MTHPFPTRRSSDLFPDHHIHPTRSYRQSASLNLAPLATAVRQGDTTTTLCLLRTANLSGVHFHENNPDPLQTHRDHLLAHWTALAEATDPADALARAARLRILTAVREGPQGARTLNARIRSEEHTSELQSLMRISYAVFCLKQKTQHKTAETT